MEQNDVDLKVKSQCALTNVFEDIMFGHKVYKMIFIMTINSFCLFLACEYKRFRRETRSMCFLCWIKSTNWLNWNHLIELISKAFKMEFLVSIYRGRLLDERVMLDENFTQQYQIRS